MQIGTFSNGDFDAVLTLLQQTHSLDNWNHDLLEEKLFGDADFSEDMTLIAEENGEIAGFMQGVIRYIHDERIGYIHERNAYIKLMAVNNDRCRQGIATQLYQALEQKFRTAGAKKVKIYDVPFNYFMPGIDPRYTPALCWAWRNGFERIGDTSNLLVDVQNQDWSTDGAERKLAEEGIMISRASASEREPLMQFIDENFPLWKTEIGNAFKSDPVAVHIATVNGAIKAFSGHNGNNFGTGWFGPMGTHPDLRGKGIGGLLLRRCLQDMKDWGLPHSIIPWVGPIAFYSHYANAVVDRVFWRFEKIL